MTDLEKAIALLSSWCAGNGDERYVTKEQCRELIDHTGEFLRKYPLAPLKHLS